MMDHAQLRQSMINKIGSKKLSTILLGYTSDVPPTVSASHKEQGLESHLLPLKIDDILLKLENVLLWESIPTSDDLRKSLQQHDLLGRPLLLD